MGVRLHLSQPTWRNEIPLFFGGVMALAVLFHVGPSSAATSTASLLWTGWLLACIIACSARAMSHADRLAERFGEPGGTIILTIAAITIEVAAVCAIMLGSAGNPTVARDSMFAVLMVIMNGLVGGCMLLGSYKRGEQSFNPDSSSAYLPLIVTLGTFALVLPRFTQSQLGGWMSDGMQIFVGGGSLVIFAAFLWMQSSRYRGYFSVGHPETAVVAVHTGTSSLKKTITMLVVSLVIVVACAEGIAGRVSSLLLVLHLPAAFGGVFIAIMVLAPEGLAALRASMRGDMQRSINVLLGSALSTIGLTVPAVLVVRWVSGIDPELGLEAPYIVLLILTFFVSALSLMRGRVNAIVGLIHLLIFLGWLVTIMDESLIPALP